MAIHWGDRAFGRDLYVNCFGPNQGQNITRGLFYYPKDNPKDYISPPTPFCAVLAKLQGLIEI